MRHSRSGRFSRLVSGLAGLAGGLLAPLAHGAEADLGYNLERWQSAPSLALPKPVAAEAVPSVSAMLPAAEAPLFGFDDIALGLTGTDIEPVPSDRVGFFGGIDTGSVMLYSMGAVLGVVGAKYGRENEDVLGGSGSSGGLAGGNTLYLEPPANFEDDEYNGQVGLGLISASHAYARGHTGDGVLVSVMDTPFNTAHPNMTDTFVSGVNVAEGNGNVALNCESAGNPCFHGTHVSGIIAANKTGEADSMHGVAYNAKVKPIPYLGVGLNGTQQMEAFGHASGVDNSTGMQIVAMNNSWVRSPQYNDDLYNGKYFRIPNQSAVTALSPDYIGSSAAADDDTILVMGAGNDGWNAETGVVYLFDDDSSGNNVNHKTGQASPSEITAALAGLTELNMVPKATAMPSNAPDNTSYVIDEAENEYMLVVVVATDSNDTIATFSNGCGVSKSYCLAAPGVGINSTNGSNASPYVLAQGTSMATPHVTGAIALLADMYPNLKANPENIIQILLETADDLGAEGVDEVYGHGLLDLEDATGPLGNMNITDSTFHAGGSVYGDSAGIITPLAFGDALIRQQVQLGSVDSFDRVFLLAVPVSGMAQNSSGIKVLAERPVAFAETAAPVEGRQLNFAGNAGEDEDAVNVGLDYTSADTDGAVGLSVRMKMNPEEPGMGLEAKTGYARYADAMAYHGETRERMSLTSAHYGDGTKITSDIRLDRNADSAITLLSQSGYERAFGPVKARLTVGGISEEGRMFGGETSGALQVARTHTIFAKAGFSLPVGRFGVVDGYYEKGRSVPHFVHDSLVSSSGLVSDSYGVSWRYQPSLGSVAFVAVNRPVAVTAGAINFNTVTGYNDDDSYRAETLSYAVAPSKRETEFVAEYRRKLMPGSKIAFGLSHQVNASNIAGRRNTSGYIRNEWVF